MIYYKDNILFNWFKELLVKFKKIILGQVKQNYKNLMFYVFIDWIFDRENCIQYFLLKKIYIIRMLTFMKMWFIHFKWQYANVIFCNFTSFDRLIICLFNWK